MDDYQRAAAAEAFRSAVAAAESQSDFARRTGVKQQTISNLLKRGGILPAEYVLAAEREFGVSKHLLRPDIYPVDEVGGDAAAVDYNRLADLQPGNEA